MQVEDSLVFCYYNSASDLVIKNLPNNFTLKVLSLKIVRRRHFVPNKVFSHPLKSSPKAKEQLGILEKFAFALLPPNKKRSF